MTTERPVLGPRASARAKLERLLSRALHRYWRIARGLTLGVRGVVINTSGEVLLVRHHLFSGWHLPGGGVEPRETIGAALARELREEGRVEILAPPKLHGVFFNAHVSARDHVAVYVVTEFRQLAGPVRNREIAEARFFALDALPPGATHGTRARLAEVFSGARVSEEW